MGLKHLSLFAGCGGIDLGFSWAGIETVAAVEIKQFACDTLKKNHSNIKVFGPPDYDGDVRKFNVNVLHEMIGDAQIDIISGGPPCQPFSVAASQRFFKDDERYKRKGDQDEEKGNLLPEYIRIINEVRPKVFVIENVASLISWNDGTFLSTERKSPKSTPLRVS